MLANFRYVCLYGLRVETTAVTGNHQDLNSNPISARMWRALVSCGRCAQFFVVYPANRTTDKPVELDSNDRSEDNSNLDNGHTPRIVTGRQLSYNASYQEHLPTISNHKAHEHGVDGIINKSKPQTVKRQRSV